VYSEKAYERVYKKPLSQIGLTTPQPPKVINAEKIEFALKTQYTYSATDTVSICQFVYGPSWQMYGPQEMADLMTATTGWAITVEEIQEIGRRRLNLMRAFNAREGLTRDDDTLPKKLFNKALAGGRSDGILIESEELQTGLDLYHEQAGWDAGTGTPTRATLEDVGLGWVADDLNL
jgi:aldehyde:ferredoxin oxidoreductase